jgi:hypothetical protein
LVVTKVEFILGIIFTTSTDWQSIHKLAINLKTAKLEIADIVYLHNTRPWEDKYERYTSFPSTNNIIHLLVIMHTAYVSELSLTSTKTNTNTNYQRITSKDVKVVWKVCIGFCIIVLCFAAAL